MNDKKLFNFFLTEKQKAKLLSDAIKNGFSSSSAYLLELIERGLPVSDSLDVRLQLIEKKVEVNVGNLEMQNKKLLTLLERAYKRIYVACRLIGYILGRTFYIKPGNISKEDLDETNRIIDKELDHVLEMFEKENKANNRW